MAPQMNQMKNRFVAKYDYDGKKCMELRQKWWTQGEREGWTFLFYHDIKNPIWEFGNKVSLDILRFLLVYTLLQYRF